MYISEGKKECFCRGCDDIIVKDQPRFETYSMRNRGMTIFFCMTCVDLIVAMRESMESQPDILEGANGQSNKC